MNRKTLFTPIKNFAALAFFGLSLISCEKFVDTSLPSNLTTTDEALANESSLVAALNGAYASVLNTANSLVTYTTLFSDEMLQFNASSSNLQAQENSYNDATDFGFFTNYYKAVYNINLILEALEKAPKPLSATAQQVKGESLFLRAFCYYRLTNLYGNVPLVLTSDVTVSSTQGNSPLEQTQDRMIEDLNLAKTLLNSDYPSADRVRANRYAVNTLLSRYYSLKQDWSQAEAEATEVIASQAYSLPDDLNQVFLKDSPETIWQLWNNNGYTAVGSQYNQSTSTIIYYRLRPELVNAFDLADKRRAAWMQHGNGDAVNDYYPMKYKQRTTSSDQIEYLVQFRLAELYLNRAEARAHLGLEQEALEDLNIVHQRSNLTPVEANGQEELLLKIEMERRLELMTEEGLRWFDLNRTGRTAFWLAPLKPTFEAHAVLLPYPITILYANPNLVQNTGY